MEEKQKFKQNLLTQGLLAAGYTVENRPDYTVLKDNYGGGKSSPIVVSGTGISGKIRQPASGARYT